MKLKNLAALALCAAFAIGTFGVAACSSNNDDNDNTDVTNTTHEHALTKTEAVAATCTTQGNKAYWHCSGCDKYFSDENAATEITLASTVIAAAGHTYEYKHDDTNHWQECSVCHDKTAETAHTYENGECSVCGAEQPAAAEGYIGTFTVDFTTLTYCVNDVESTDLKEEYASSYASTFTVFNITFTEDNTATFNCTQHNVDFTNSGESNDIVYVIDATYALANEAFTFTNCTYTTLSGISEEYAPTAESLITMFNFGYDGTNVTMKFEFGSYSDGSGATYAYSAVGAMTRVTN